MVIDPAHSPEGVEVRLSIAILLFLLTGPSRLRFHELRVVVGYEAGYDTTLALLIAKPMPAVAVTRWEANWQAHTEFRLPPLAYDAGIIPYTRG
jgi:hypothetical protein